jgi:hypothetical protein
MAYASIFFDSLSETFKVQIIFAAGDMMAVAQISRYQGPSSSFPCISCIAPKLQPFNRGGCYIPEIARL